MKQKLWIIYPLAMVLWGLIYLSGPEVLNSGPAYNVIGLAAVVGIVIGTRLNRPSKALPWYLLAGGQAVFLLGDIVGYNYKFIFGFEPSYPSLADAFYLAMYPIWTAGILLFIHYRKPAHAYQLQK